MFPPLPQSLLTAEHLDWMNQAIKILDNLQYHIDQAHRAGIPMEEHQANLDKHRATLAKYKSVYFPQGV